MTHDRTPEMDAAAAEFAAYMNAPWGRLRADMIVRQLAVHTDDRPLRVLDAGCGPGVLAARMAKAGHDVTGVDLSPGMLEQAKKSADDAGVRVDLHVGRVDDLDGIFPDEKFDLVLCHCVIEYVDDPAVALKQIAGVLAPGGVVSLLASNSLARVFKAAIVDRNPLEALAAYDRVQQPNTVFRTSSRTFRHDELLPLVSGAGLAPLEVYGVRTFWDLLSRDDRPVEQDFYDGMLELELAMSTTSPFRDVANYFHVVAGHA